MNLEKFLKDVVLYLEKEGHAYALAGGLLASLYRDEKRFTQDLDFLFYSDSHSQKNAEKIIKHFGLVPHYLRQAQLSGGPLFAIKNKTSPVWMVVGRPESKTSRIGLDFILPTIPWFSKALSRAMENRIDFGFAKIPCLTVEDIIIAKIHGAQNLVRFKDLDDLQSIFKAEHPLDFDYLSGELKAHDFNLSKNLQAILPKQLSRVLKKNKL